MWLGYLFPALNPVGLFPGEDSSDARQSRILPNQCEWIQAVLHPRLGLGWPETHRPNFATNAYRSRRLGRWQRPEGTRYSIDGYRSKHLVGGGNRRTPVFYRRRCGGSAFSIAPNRPRVPGMVGSIAVPDKLEENLLSGLKIHRRQSEDAWIDRSIEPICLGRPRSRPVNYRKNQIQRSGNRIAGSPA